MILAITAQMLPPLHISNCYLKTRFVKRSQANAPTVADDLGLEKKLEVEVILAVRMFSKQRNKI